MILLDTSILIDYFRKSKKENTIFQKISLAYNDIYISQITYFEILRGSNSTQSEFWLDIFENLILIDFDKNCAEKAVKIYKELKLSNQLIDTADLLIGATAMAFNLSLATCNTKDFKRIKRLDILEI